MAKKTPMAGLESAVKKILYEYEETFKYSLDEATAAVAKAGAKAVKANAKGYGWQKYPSGWTSRTQHTRLMARACIYNDKYPGLAHLLEFGHALPNGGRTTAKPHIAQVEQMLDKEYFEAVQNAVRGRVTGYKDRDY